MTAKSRAAVAIPDVKRRVQSVLDEPAGCFIPDNPDIQ
jgi:hypothetical protein